MDSAQITPNVTAVPGARVTFAVTAGGGSVSGGTAATGIAAAASWTLGELTGTNTLRASVDGSAAAVVTFTATSKSLPSQ
ncbi:MAG: hypothetical protein ACT4OZ_04855 [Gemmatimonadota bacterium]